MKKRILLLLFLCLPVCSFSQTDTLLPFNTAVKLNINGLKLGIEHRIYKNISLQFEVGPIPGAQGFTYKPQVRVYYKVNRTFTYLGLAYFYKHQANNYNDTIRRVNTDGHYIGNFYRKDFRISKYIHAITLNTGAYWWENVFGIRILLEANLGLGIRYKKSNRYGLDPDEAFDLQEATFIRPAHYQDTRGRFMALPELNATLSLAIPIN